MTKHEFMRRLHLIDALTGLGFTEEEANKLRTISNTLRNWFERECGTDAGAIERDEETGKPFFRNGRGKRFAVADLERGAMNRLAKIMADRNSRGYVPLPYYIQTDPRGAALYILRPGDVPDGKDAAAYHSRGICVY
jgi:hypothetical protein